MMYARIAIGVTALITMIRLHKAKAQNKESFDGFRLVDQAGNISKPDDYSDRYQMFGAYTVLDPKGDQMHFTYASPREAEYLPEQQEIR